MSVYNLLVLGQTGTGKSTWINSIANYLKYETLEDALAANQPSCLIPTKFLLMTDDYEEVEISFGRQDANENRDTALSCTKQSRVYSFRHQHETLNIIDVPGIGDVGGVDQDATNMKNILDTVGLFKELHAICILLKSTDNKLTVDYRYCLSELLMHLHKNALNNVMFVFTHTRGADYRPGQAHVPLKAYLEELKRSKGIQVTLSKEVMYCIDNEAFRYQCAYFQRPEFRDYNWQDFARSWRHGREATFRIIERMRTLRSHRVVETLSINEARAVILMLIQPLATITALIQQNLANYQVNFDQVVTQLQNNLAVSDFDIILEELARPRTVCTAKRCISVEKLANSNAYTTHYKQICHETCYLTNVPLKRHPEPALAQCAAMQGQPNCQRCGCHHSEHMHIDYNQKVVQKPSALNQKFHQINNQPTKVMAETELRKMMEELQHEQKTVSTTMVRFGFFLQSNAVFEYNFDFEERLKMEIRKEEVIAQNTGSNVAVQRIQATLDDYIQQRTALKAVIDAGQARGDYAISAEEVVQLKNDLFQLPLHGSKIEQLYNMGREKNMDNYEHQHFLVHNVEIMP